MIVPQLLKRSSDEPDQPAFPRRKQSRTRSPFLRDEMGACRLSTPKLLLEDPLANLTQADLVLDDRKHGRQTHRDVNRYTHKPLMNICNVVVLSESASKVWLSFPGHDLERPGRTIVTTSVGGAVVNLFLSVATRAASEQTVYSAQKPDGVIFLWDLSYSQMGILEGWMRQAGVRAGQIPIFFLVRSIEDKVARSRCEQNLEDRGFSPSSLREYDPPQVDEIVNQILSEIAS